jgi:predicted hydrocarbon binding protein
MIETTTSYYFPNRLGRRVLLAFEEIMGKQGINSLLNLASLSCFLENYPSEDDHGIVSFEIISQLQYALEQAYGPRGGRGLALRIGRVFFSACLRSYGSDFGFNDPNFRLQPIDLKTITALRTLTEFFNRHTNQKITLEESERHILWYIERCPWCWGRHDSEPVCHFAVGLLQEALYWVSGGKFYNIVEETCVALGDEICLVTIERIPQI